LARHGNSALVSPYLDQYNKWFLRGGLIFVTKDNVPVAGELCYKKNNTFHFIERGVLNASDSLFRQGVESILTWHSLVWANANGAESANMGASRALQSDGAFKKKALWGSTVTECRKIHTSFRFLAKDLPPVLLTCLNELEIVAKVDKEFFGVVIRDQPVSEVPAVSERDLRKAQHHGLSGLVFFPRTAHASRMILRCTDRRLPITPMP
jgi:hypothetical protein